MAKLSLGLHRINILISQTNQPKLYIKILRWLISSGRYIVILAEFVVIAGFIYRFKLDSDLVDLEDKIKEQLPYIQSLKKEEILVRHVQQQLTIVAQTKKEALDPATTLQRIAQLTPKNIRLTNINLDHSTFLTKPTLKIIGVSPSSYEIAAFIKALQKDPYFSDIQLGNVTLDKQQMSFTISGSLNTTYKSSSS